MKILILSSSTGGGHDLRAESFRRWASLHADLQLEASVHRPLEAAGLHYKWGVGFNNQLQIVWPGFHHVYWNILEHGRFLRFRSLLVGMEHFRKVLQDYRPDAVMSVHPQLNHAFFDYCRAELGERLKRVIYCGELDGGYGFSRLWVNPQADLFIGATEACCEQARRLGMAPEKTFLGGFLLRPESYRPPLTPKERADYLHSEHGLDPTRFTLLLSTGGTGANNHPTLLEALDAARLDCQVIALCGKNPAVLERVRAWRGQNQRLTVRALPYSQDMFRLISAVSAMVVRPGAGSTSECLLAGCPVISNCLGGTMAQECATLRGLSRAGVLRRMDRASDLVTHLRGWLKQPETLTETRHRLLAAVPPGSPQGILQRVAALWR